MLVAVIFTSDYYTRYPYYNEEIKKAYCFCVHFYFWIIFTYFSCDFINLSQLKDNVIWIIIFGLCFLYKVINTTIEFTIRSFITNETEFFNTQHVQNSRFRYLRKIFKNSDKNPDNLFFTLMILTNHLKQCKDIHCVCRNRSNLYDPSKKETACTDTSLHKDPIFQKFFQFKIIADSVSKMKRSSVQNLSQFHYLFEDIENISLVINYIESYKKMYNNKSSITLEFCIYRLKISIKKYLKKYNNNIDISRQAYENIRYHDIGMEKLKKIMVKSTDYYVQMWIIQRDIDLKLLNKVVQKLTNLKKKAMDIYHKILSRSSKSIEFRFLMKLYFDYIIMDPQLSLNSESNIFSNKLNSQIYENTSDTNFNFSTYIKEMNFMDENCCSISISLKDETFGLIIWNSENCQKLFGHGQKYFNKLNIDYLQPPVLSVHHNSFLETFRNKGKTNFLNNINTVWGKILYQIIYIFTSF